MSGVNKTQTQTSRCKVFFVHVYKDRAILTDFNGNILGVHAGEPSGFIADLASRVPCRYVKDDLMVCVNEVSD